MTAYKYKVSPRCYQKIYSFYHHVALKYRHDYSEEDMYRNIDETVDSMYEIERTLLRREPTLTRWKGYYMANTDKWYFAYLVEGDTVKIMDACHAQNMHNPKKG